MFSSLSPRITITFSNGKPQVTRNFSRIRKLAIHHIPSLVQAVYQPCSKIVSCFKQCLAGFDDAGDDNEGEEPGYIIEDDGGEEYRTLIRDECATTEKRPTTATIPVVTIMTLLLKTLFPVL